ncbi:hypothetical protein ACJRO7_026235 [Eucalyptus globulus]|uniref:non-specific serine/threonine protein kinase n=1 Tax=Eucalyptus globulus TaxID=34317 RepID=A0ABD3KHL5_EUCGL
MGTHFADANMEHKWRAIQRSRDRRLHFLRRLQPFHQMRLLLQQFHYLPHCTAVHIDSISPTMCVSYLMTGWFFSGCSRVYALSIAGPIPDELWNLTYLFDLNLAQNLLTGSLSPSIGNLTRMQYLSLAINALSGELPSQLAQLTELLALSFSTNNFSGSLPSELGNLSKLQQLNTFSGCKWASDNNFTGNIPEFIGNWSQLAQLFLQGNSFEGSIPSTFSNLTALTDLRISDVSNVSSSLEFIRNMKNLSILNNNISDSLPLDFSGYQIFSPFPSIANSVLNIVSFKVNYFALVNMENIISILDVSYNNLMGSIPSWVSYNIQLNLVGNNFTFGNNFTLDNSNASLLPGLNCLQWNFPCNTGNGIYYNFSVKCGGPQNTLSSNIVYEQDSISFGPATYYVTNSERWAVSNVGYFTGSYDPTNSASLISQFTETLDSELFQTARVSASSLRYYGLGLENGNYNVTFQFEIHFFCAGKGTCCVPNQATYEPPISAISAVPDFIPTVSNNPPTRKRDCTGLIVGVATGVGVVGLVAVLLVFYVFRRRRMARMIEDQEFLGMDASPYTFSYAELKAAADDFNPNKKTWGGIVIAVKQLSVISHQGKNQFVIELATISAVQHHNLVKSIARGLAYLHEESRLKIVHRDVKASNILLDSDLTPKISDFGLAKLYDDKKTHISTRVAGTIGYLAPEYAMRGHLTENADVVALEVVSGRSN